MKKILFIFSLCFYSLFAFSQGSNNPRPNVLAGVFDKSVFDLYYQNQLFRNTFATVKDGADTVVYFVDNSGNRKLLKGTGGSVSILSDNGVTKSNDTLQLGVLFGDNIPSFQISNEQRGIFSKSTGAGLASGLVFNAQSYQTGLGMYVSADSAKLENMLLTGDYYKGAIIHANYPYFVEMGMGYNDTLKSYVQSTGAYCLIGSGNISNNINSGITVQKNFINISTRNYGVNSLMTLRPDSLNIDKRGSYSTDISSTLQQKPNSFITKNFLDYKSGTATLVAGNVTVSNTNVRAGSKILVSHKTPSGTMGILSIGTIVSGTSFVINSNSGTDTSTVNWWIIN